MIKNKLRNLRSSIETRSSLDLWTIASSVFILLVLVYGVISLSPFPAEVENCIYVLAILILIGCYFCFRARRHASEFDNNDKSHPPTERISIPPMPQAPPGIGKSLATSTSDSPYEEEKNDDAVVRRETLKVLRSIDQTNKQIAQYQQQEELEKRRRAEKRNELLNSQTVHYDDIPGFIYFVRRGLWKMLIAWITFGLVTLVVLGTAGQMVNSSVIILLAILFLICTWFSIRCIVDWRWERRQIIGIRMHVHQPKSGLLLLFGGDYSASLLKASNALVKQEKYERIIWFLRTATVSVDTPRQNAEDGEDANKGADVFNDMKNMRNPETFRDICMSIHEQLTLSQSDPIKRSDY